MKKTSFGAIFAAAIALFSCGTGEENISSDYLTLSVQPNDVVKLSDFAEKIEFIKLANDSLLKGIEQLVVDKNGNMLIRDAERCFSLQLYAPDGKLICPIGKRGNGPGEYIFVEGIDIDNGKIFVDNPGKNGMMAYDMKGNFLPDIPEMNTVYHTNFVVKGDTLIKCHGGSYISFDINGQPYREQIKEREKEGTGEAPPLHIKSHLAKNIDDGTVYWERHYNDTIFEAVGGNIKPFLHVDFGDLKLPEDIPVDNLISFNEEAKKYCTDISNFKISDGIISFMFDYRGSVYTCIYNRDTKKQYVYRRLQNDINNIPIMHPLIQAVQGKKIYFYVAPDIIAQIIDAIKESTKKEDLELLKKLTDTIGEVDEMDNPYIAVVTCK
ncbi:MAG: 6-bladed beta-propeller [Bacteroidaceae bacterium]|nr:6-bladed beta-propeller [Bacteroidaceae bacterium]